MTQTARLERYLVGIVILTGTPFFTGLSEEDQKPAATFERVLFLGNSITKHGPKEKIGWSGNWGMAASEEDKDYVHLVTDGLFRNAKTPGEAMVRNIAGFEREYATYDLGPLLKEARHFNPDLVILAIGENVPKLKTPKSVNAFTHSIRKLLEGLDNNEATILVRSSFWANETKDRVLCQVCEEAGGTFVDIGHLGEDESNYARSERDLAHEGVAAHPGDEGMRAIADAILTVVEEVQSQQDE